MNNLSVLIVDDNTEFSAGLKRIFESFGWSAQTAENSEKAKFLFTDDIFDLVIVDCFIPESDGFFISKELSDLNSKTKGDCLFFLMSGILVDAASEKEALSYSYIQHFVKKPVDTEGLKKSLKSFFPESKKTVMDAYIQENSTLEHFILSLEDSTSLDKTEIPFFIKQLSELEFCGEIKFDCDGTETVLNFNSGEITGIFSQDFEYSIGELLVGMGFLTRKNLSSYISSDYFKNSKKRIGEVLVDKNYISPHAVPLALKAQKKLRLDKLLCSVNTVDFTIDRRPKIEHDAYMSLGTHEITNCLMNFMQSLDNSAFQAKILKTFKGLRASLNSTILKEQNSISDADAKNALEKYNEEERLSTTETKTVASLLLFRALDFNQPDESTAVGSIEKSQIKEKMRYLSKKIKLETPFDILDLNPDHLSDQKVSKKYQNLAKELHPDKLIKILNQDELKEAARIFSEITRAFNCIKTAENRQTYDSLKANQRAQDQIDCNNILETAKKALHSGKYTEAIKLLDDPKMHKNQPNEFGLYYLWASFKSKNHVLKQQPNTILDTENKNLKCEALYYYLKALIALKNGDNNGFQKFIGLSLRADSYFLPARRELQIVRSQNVSKPEKTGWFSFKKSS